MGAYFAFCSIEIPEGIKHLAKIEPSSSSGKNSVPTFGNKIVQEIIKIPPKTLTVSNGTLNNVFRIKAYPFSIK